MLQEYTYMKKKEKKGFTFTTKIKIYVYISFSFDQSNKTKQKKKKEEKGEGIYVIVSKVTYTGGSDFVHFLKQKIIIIENRCIEKRILFISSFVCVCAFCWGWSCW